VVKAWQRASGGLEPCVEEGEYSLPGVDGRLGDVSVAHREKHESAHGMLTFGHETVSRFVVDLDVVVDTKLLEMPAQPLRWPASEDQITP